MVEDGFVGIDGCRSGWCIVHLGENNNWKVEVVEDTQGLASWIASSTLTLIDIPIGLLDNGGPQRVCDHLARGALGMPRAASVFPVPSRCAVYADNYEQACRINRQRLGKRLSKQSWNITQKIKQVDELLQKHGHFNARLKESHPEVCFWALNKNTPMRFNKKTPLGRNERLRLLEVFLPHCTNILDFAAEKYPRKELALDDIIDAIVLAVSALMGQESLCTFPAEPPKDKLNLKMEIVYPLVENP